MKWEKLGNLGRIVSGSTPSTSIARYWEGIIPWVTPADLAKNKDIVFNGSPRKISEEGYNSCSTIMLPTGSILFSSRAPIGHCAVASFPVCTNQGMKSIVPNNELDSIYGYFALRHFTEDISDMGRGATFDEITKEMMEGFEIPLPPLAEQRRIAAILRAADDERRRRRYTQTLSDGLLAEVFVRMFGDPATNPMGWERISLGDVLISATDGPHVSPEYVDSGIPFLSTRNIRPGQIIWKDMKFISLDDARLQWKKVKPKRGDILYTKGGSTGLAKAVDFDRDVAVWVHIAVLKIRNEQVVPVWLENMLNTEYCYEQSQELTMGIVNRDLGLLRMPKIQMYLPPFELQEQYTIIATMYDQTRRQQQESARQSDHLFDTLLHRAFSGEL